MKELNFEKALKDLETTVGKLEQGDLSLEESLKLFEKGIKLAKFLRSELEKAEKKVEILLKDEEGNVSAEPFDMDENDKQPPGDDEEDKEDPDNGGNESLPF
ncbi:MAG: exodeoxyribonuclease VII small subunit [Candidatus Aminicenantes bacterium]|nr:exodeoxyribonuclease VII small subunit [Candidatus Aminicenantes bacterium]